jgi:hypothetical protein
MTRSQEPYDCAHGDSKAPNARLSSHYSRLLRDTAQLRHYYSPVIKGTQEPHETQLPTERRLRGDRAIPLGQRRTRLVLSRFSGALGDGMQVRLLSHHIDHGTSAPTFDGIVRSPLPQPGYHAEGRLRQPDRVPFPASCTRRGLRSRLRRRDRTSRAGDRRPCNRDTRRRRPDALEPTTFRTHEKGRDHRPSTS